MKLLYKTTFGSFLYGTNTPLSDRDYMTVYLPAINKLLLGYSLKNSQETTSDKNQKNTVDDVDSTFIPVQVFMDDFVSGQTYALELCFSVLSKDHTDKDLFPNVYTSGQTPFEKLCEELATNFLSRNISAMMGYAANQAIKYGVKGTRYEVVETFVNHLKTLQDDDRLTSTVEWVSLNTGKYLRNDTYLAQNKVDQEPCIVLLEKIYPLTISVKEALERSELILKKYGHRSKKAADCDGADWKALSHTIRIGEQIIQILRDEKLSFPFEPKMATFLTDIKLGKIDHEEVLVYMRDQLDLIDSLKTSTTLPEKETLWEDFLIFKESKLKDLYSYEAIKYFGFSW